MIALVIIAAVSGKDDKSGDPCRGQHQTKVGRDTDERARRAKPALFFAFDLLELEVDAAEIIFAHAWRNGRVRHRSPGREIKRT